MFDTSTQGTISGTGSSVPCRMSGECLGGGDRALWSADGSTC